MSEPVKPPAPAPCTSCPYRKNVPSGVWSAEDYEKLREYDAPLGEQPPTSFLCHLKDRDSPASRLCAGWVGCHGGRNLLGLRMARHYGAITMETLVAALQYTTQVPLFASGAEAADHGQAEIESPGPQANALITKIVRLRPDVFKPQNTRRDGEPQ